MNILTERKRSKVFERKCSYLDYEATPGITQKNRMTPVTNSLRLGCWQFASCVGMR